MLQNIQLTNFRNIADKVIQFHPKRTFIIGENAHGKTNILESIHVLLTGKGLKDGKQEELIMFEAQFAELRGMYRQNETPLELRIRLQQEENLKKAYFVDRSKKMLFTYTRETPPAVIFAPERMDIISGSPSIRRRYVDTILSDIDEQYKKALRNYSNGMRRRNKILEKALSPESIEKELVFWNEYLIEHATYIHTKRKWLIEELNKESTVDDHVFRATYIENIVSHERFKDYAMKEFYQRRTLIGPQREDFRILKVYPSGKDVDVHTFCSRGEQRLALFWLILRQLDLYKEYISHSPILLLDDIFSELDDANQERVNDIIGSYQTILTTTHEGQIASHKLDGDAIMI